MFGQASIEAQLDMDKLVAKIRALFKKTL